MLPIAKRFLDRKRKNNEEEKKVELSLLGFKLPVSLLLQGEPAFNLLSYLYMYINYLDG